MIKTLISFCFFMAAFQTTPLLAKTEGSISCLSHGDCQVEYPLTTSGVRCLIVKTGQRYDGTTTCAKRCYKVEIAYKCGHTEENKIGLCEQESFEVPKFDPSNPDCSNAVDPISSF